MASRTIIWSLESSRQVDIIKRNILEDWSQKEVSYFLEKLKSFEKLVGKFPFLYPKSLKYPTMRKAVISRHNSVIYEVEEDVIKIHTVLINRQEK